MAVVISSDLVLSEAEAEIPLSYPRILYDDVWRTGTVTASSEDTDAPAANVADGLTWDFWMPSDLPSTIEVQLTEAAVVDYALLQHTLGSSECTVSGEYHDGSGWQPLFDEYSPGTDRVLAFLFEPVTASRFRLSLDGENSPQQMPSISIAMMGTALAMQRSVPLDHGPITMQRRTMAMPQTSEGGKLLGRSIRRQGVVGRIEFQYLQAAWFRTYFEPFIEAARVYPFGWVWKPIDYPSEVALLWTPGGKEDIRPVMAGLQDRMNVAFDVEGVIE